MLSDSCLSVCPVCDGVLWPNGWMNQDESWHGGGPRPRPHCVDRRQIAKPQVLMASQHNCSKQQERQHWTECTEYVWRSGKLVSGQRNGRSLHTSHFPRKLILNSVKTIQNNCSGFPCQQDSSSDHTGKDPSEDKNRNWRRAGRN